MRTALVIGIVLSVFTGACGLYLLACGAMMGIFGLWVDGPIHSAWIRVWGVGLFLLGGVYLVPVLVFSRRSVIITYALVALGCTALALLAFGLDPGTRTDSLWEPLSLALLLLTCPAVLSGIALLRSRSRSRPAQPVSGANGHPPTP